MKIKEELNELITRLHKDGVTVYAHVWDEDKEITYINFVKDNKIGYAQYDRFEGLKFSTVHKPNKETGTGFQVDCSINNYTEAFHPPLWARSFHSPQWTSWEDFLSHQHYNNYVKVI